VRIGYIGLDSCNYKRFKNRTDFHGAIYAPNANITFDDFADVRAGKRLKSALLLFAVKQSQ
jgi:hypothetical protein